MDVPILSIIVPVYNHERYLLTALKSIEQQNIRYPFEVLIGEDCSADSSGLLLRDYQKHAPDNYSFFYRECNMGMLYNISDLIYRARGKYLIILETDDYWIYREKINRQIDFLQQNPQYSGVAHSVVVIDKNGSQLDMTYSCEKGSGEYSFKDYLKEKLPGQTASFMYRNYFTDKKLFRYMGDNTLYPLDRFIAFVVASQGPVFCTSDKWSAYRYVTGEGSSFSANYDIFSEAVARSNFLYYQSLYKYALEENGNSSCIRASEKLYFKAQCKFFLQSSCKKKEFSYKKAIKKIKELRYPVSTVSWLFDQLIRYVLRNAKGKR